MASKLVGQDMTPRSQELTNLGTFVGALCFFAGALVLLSERTAALRDTSTTDAERATT